LGDPSWDADSPYLERDCQLAAGGLVIDLHMMRPRGVDICVGLGPRPELTERLWPIFVEEAVAGGLRPAVNWPFAAVGRTLTSQLQRRGIPAVQLELSGECFDRDHPAMPRAWTSVARAAARLRLALADR
jgi:hypothetical protein